MKRLIIRSESCSGQRREEGSGRDIGRVVYEGVAYE